jgi:MoaA/NifB/PqqE/SkfB family radical SAM enzyme
VELNEIGDSTVRGWWWSFQNSNLSWPNGRTRPELTLTIPVGEHLLNGRFDLLITDNQNAHIFDWKTGKPRPVGHLRHDWQTRLYLAMIAESGDALGQRYVPDDIAITYWYVAEPDEPRTIHYSQSWHEQNWGEIWQLVDQIEAELVQDSWPLTEDWNHCRVCAYQAYCGRQTAGTADTILDEDEEILSVLPLEPNIP